MRLLAAALLLTSAACAHAPSPTNHWTLQTSDGASFTFQSCGLLGSGNEITEFISGGSGVVQKLPGKLRVFDAVCRRGLTSDRGLWTWRAAVGTAAGRKDATLQLHDAAGTVIAKWNLADVWPARLEVSDATETVTFAIDALERVPQMAHGRGFVTSVMSVTESRAPRTDVGVRENLMQTDARNTETAELDDSQLDQISGGISADLTSDTNTSRFNPKELTIDKPVPWKRYE